MPRDVTLCVWVSHYASLFGFIGWSGIFFVAGYIKKYNIIVFPVFFRWITKNLIKERRKEKLQISTHFVTSSKLATLYELCTYVCMYGGPPFDRSTDPRPHDTNKVIKLFPINFDNEIMMIKCKCIHPSFTNHMFHAAQCSSVQLKRRNILF